jgi:4-amino-4-deoxy-L-arabinose transferase-like glycosyltransferase
MNNKKSITFIFLLTAVEALGAIIWLGCMPSESGNAAILGYSIQRLIMMGTLAILGLLCLFAAWSTSKTTSLVLRLEQYFNNPWIGLGAGLVVLISWMLCFSPAYQWGRFAGYKDRLFPIILWLLFVDVQTCFLFIKMRKQSHPGSLWTILNKETELLKSFGFALGTLTIGLLIVAIFRVGLIPDIVYWNDANVPILSFQIIGVITVSVLFLGLLSQAGFFSVRKQSKLQLITPDILICLFIWSLAVVVWTQIEMPHSYFSPGPYLPNNEMYPFSDAAGYDKAAQSAVIGEGLGTQNYVDKPFYVAFLTTIHLLVGDSMDSVVGLQVAIIALIPVLIYLIGLKIHSRLAGLIAAGFFICREINNIQGTLWVLSTNSRVLMSESLVTLLLVFFVLMFIGWVKNIQNPLFIMATGGALGLAALVRLNPLLLMPITFVVIWLLCWKRWKTGLVNSLLFITIFLATLMPWMIQSYDRHGRFLYFYSAMHGVVLEQRTYYSLNPTPVARQTQTPVSPDVAPQQPNEVEQVNRTWNKITGISRYGSAHFFHNLVTGIAMFPTTLTLDSLEQTIKAPHSYWSADWTGDLQTGELVMVFLAIILLALGIAASWSRNQWAALIPVGFIAAYSLATAAARTSGGRYFIPADWVFLLYFAIGISQLVVWINKWLNGTGMETVLEPAEKSPSMEIPGWKMGAIACLFILLGSLPAILDRVIPSRYIKVEKSELPGEFSQSGVLKSLGISKDELDKFLKLPDAVAYRGKGLYPRYYAQDQGEPDRFSPMRSQPFPRLVLDIIGPTGTDSGVLPMEKMPVNLPNGKNVLVIGCNNKLNDEWLALFVEGADSQIILRSPAAKWTCPVTLPVCDDNRICE